MLIGVGSLLFVSGRLRPQYGKTRPAPFLFFIMKDNKDYWRNKYFELLEKHVRVGEAILKAMKNIEPKKKTKPSKGTGKSRGK